MCVGELPWGVRLTVKFVKILIALHYYEDTKGALIYRTSYSTASISDVSCTSACMTVW